MHLAQSHRNSEEIPTRRRSGGALIHFKVRSKAAPQTRTNPVSFCSEPPWSVVFCHACPFTYFSSSITKRHPLSTPIPIHMLLPLKQPLPQQGIATLTHRVGAHDLAVLHAQAMAVTVAHRPVAGPRSPGGHRMPQ
jgi:hypothetical protein